jgi:hypothetical protein
MHVFPQCNAARTWVEGTPVTLDPGRGLCPFQDSLIWVGRTDVSYL